MATFKTPQIIKRPPDNLCKLIAFFPIKVDEPMGVMVCCSDEEADLQDLHYTNVAINVNIFFCAQCVMLSPTHGFRFSSCLYK